MCIHRMLLSCLVITVLAGCSNAEDSAPGGAQDPSALQLIDPEEAARRVFVSTGQAPGWVDSAGALLDLPIDNGYYVVTLGPNERIRLIFRELSVAPGDVITASFNGYALEQAEIIITIARLCNNERGDDYSIYNLNLTSEPKNYLVAHAFEEHYQCVYFDFQSRNGATFYVNDPTVERLVSVP